MVSKHKETMAIDRAKNFFGRVESEPLVPTDRVLLRELVHALEILWGYTDHELQYGSDSKSPQALSDALTGGEITARVYDPNLSPELSPIIPKVAWRKIRPEKGEDASHAPFWMHAIRYDSECDGFVGCLPFVIRDEAEDWLSDQSAGFEDYTTRNRYLDVVIDAKSVSSQLPDGPRIDQSHLTLPEIIYIAEKMMGDSAQRISHGYTEDVLESVLSALTHGQLAAYFFENDRPIASCLWTNERDVLLEALKKSLGRGDKIANSENFRLQGSTPVFSTDKVGDWISEIALGSPKDRMTKFKSEGELEAWFEDDYVPSIDPRRRPSSVEREKAIIARDAIEIGDKRERARRIRRRCEPPGWSNAGRPKLGE